MNTHWHNPVRIVCGETARQQLPALLAGRTCAIITTPGTVNRGEVQDLKTLCRDQIKVISTRVQPNPTIASVTAAATELSAHSFEVLVALGGGSTLDTAKAVAAVRSSGLTTQWLADHLRLKSPFPVDFSPLPLIAIPTTAGTGSEVTQWGTIWDEVSGKKCSLSHPLLFPEAALIDPALTLSLPWDLTLSTGLDSLSHAMESIWNKHANPVSDSLAAAAIVEIPEALRRIKVSPGDVQARKSQQQASLLAGMAISSTATAIAHSISYPLTLQTRMPHGLACSFTLGEVLRINGAAFPERTRIIIRALGAGDLNQAVELIYGLFRDLELATQLRKYLPDESSVRNFEGDLIAPGRADRNVVDFAQNQAKNLLESAWKKCTA